MSDKRMTDEAFETAEGERVWREARSAESITEKKIAEALALAGVATLSFHCHVCNHQWDEVRAADEEGYLDLYGFCSICRSNGKSEPWLAEETRLPISVSGVIKSLAAALAEARAQLAAVLDAAYAELGDDGPQMDAVGAVHVLISMLREWRGACDYYEERSDRKHRAMRHLADRLTEARAQLADRNAEIARLVATIREQDAIIERGEV